MSRNLFVIKMFDKNCDKALDGRGGWGYSDRFWYILCYTDHTILDQLIELCPFMQTVILH